MVNLLKYEFKSMRSYFSVFILVVTIAFLAQLTVKDKGFELGVLVTFPVLIGIFAVIVTGFYNEVVNGREQLIYQTPCSIYKILGAKLINAFIMVLLISLLINIFNMITGYVPFMGISGTLRRNRLPDSYKNIIRLFSVLWNSTIILALIALSNFVTAVRAAFFKNRWFGTAALVVIGIGLFYGFIWLAGTIMSTLPVNLVMDNGICLRFSSILNNVDFVNRSSSAFSIGISNSAAATFYEDDFKVVLGLTSIIANLVVTAIAYPVTAWIMKKKVFV